MQFTSRNIYKKDLKKTYKKKEEGRYRTTHKIRKINFFVVWQYSTSTNGNERKNVRVSMWLDLDLTLGVIVSKEEETLTIRFYPNLCQGRDCLGKEVRYAFDMVLKHSQKGDSDLQRLATIEIPLIG